MFVVGEILVPFNQMHLACSPELPYYNDYVIAQLSECL